MSNVSAKKVHIQIESAAEQQEHIRNQRKPLKALQNSSAQKENISGRQQIDKLSRLKAAADITLATTEHGKRKKVETRAAETQTSPIKKSTDAKCTITAEDLTTTGKPSEGYFERLAEKRRLALQEAFDEIHTLNERIECLEEQLNTKDQLLEESRTLVEVLKEMLEENEAPEDGPLNDDDSDTRSSATSAEAAKEEGLQHQSEATKSEEPQNQAEAE